MKRVTDKRLLNIAATSIILGVFCGQSAIAEEIEEVIVTAQKRAQNLNDVGISVTALSGTDIKELRLTQPEDIAAQTPNLRINNTTANSVPNITLRGIGVNDYAVNNNPAAGVYVDDVYFVSPAMMSFQMFDLDRVEVLKGPQGTLYGRNTTAGAINFISNKPHREFEVGASVDYGRYDYTAVEAFINGAVSESLMGRLAVQTTQQWQGHQENRITGNDVGEIDRVSWRGMLDWQPVEDLNILLNVHGGRDNSDIHLVKLINDPDDDVQRSGAYIDPYQDIDSDGVSITMNWSINDDFSLISVTGYEHLTRYHVEDRDATTSVKLDGFYDNDIEQVSQELRLIYDNSSDLTLIAGAFYSFDEVVTRDKWDTWELLAAFGLPGQFIGNDYDQETRSAAVFGHAEWQFHDDWKLTAGVRYTDDKKEFSNAHTFLIIDGVDTPIYPPIKDEISSSNVSGKLALDYTGIEDTLIYASASKGYKSGGYQGQLAFTPEALVPFDEEILWAYEVGAKALLLDNSLQINGALFFYDYQDLQSFGTFQTVVGPLWGLTNAGDAEIKGAEVDVRWKPITGLDIRLGLGLLDAEITEPAVADINKGNRLANSPDVSFNGIVRYEWPIQSGWNAFVMTDFNYQDDIFFDIYETPDVKEDAYWLVNASVGIQAADGRWKLAVWGKNIADKEYRTMSQVSSVGFVDSYGLPPTYGVSVSYNWQ